MQREEAVECRIVDCKAAKQQLLDRLTDTRERREEAGNNRGPPERHLTPWQNIAHESGCHHQKQDHNTEDPEHFARRLVGTVIHAAGDMEIDGDKEERRAVGVHVAQQPSGIDVAHDLFDRLEGDRSVSRIVHRQHDTGQDLHDQHDHENAAECVGVIEVPRNRVGNKTVMHHPRERQACIHPLSETGSGLIGRMIAAHGLKPLNRFR